MDLGGEKSRKKSEMNPTTSIATGATPGRPRGRRGEHREERKKGGGGDQGSFLPPARVFSRSELHGRRDRAQEACRKVDNEEEEKKNYCRRCRRPETHAGTLQQTFGPFDLCPLTFDRPDRYIHCNRCDACQERLSTSTLRRDGAIRKKLHFESPCLGETDWRDARPEEAQVRSICPVLLSTALGVVAFQARHAERRSDRNGVSRAAFFFLLSSAKKAKGRPFCRWSFVSSSGNVPVNRALHSAHGVHRDCSRADPCWFAPKATYDVLRSPYGGAPRLHF